MHSLIETPLQVPLPLHVSLSAPLVLRTESKDTFLDDITEQLKSVVRSLRQPIKVRPASLSWHGNEDSSRYFLVRSSISIPVIARQETFHEWRASTENLLA